MRLTRSSALVERGDEAIRHRHLRHHLMSAMIVILPQDRLSDRAMCQNTVGAAKIEPAINLSRPESIFSLPSNRPP